MTTFPNSPKVVKGGIVLIDAKSGATLNMISMQYNPESLSRRQVGCILCTKKL